jgi:cell division protein FtsI (penicillin-binding protein 3)
MSHGYGISVTPLQLAHAYAVVGALGLSRPVSFLRVDAPPTGQRVLDEGVCRELIRMLESVVLEDGATGRKAAIPGYRVAGKTGTAYKASAGGYSTDEYMSVFGGIAPATDPRLAAVIVIDTPSAGLHLGGDVAAPVFSSIVGGALRLLAVTPDQEIVAPADEQPAPSRVRAPTHTVAQR